jgi:general secretion pathway protein L
MILRLPAPGEEETEWLIIGDEAASGPTRQRGTLSLAAAVWRSGRLIVLAPAAQVLLAEPELPPGTGPKIARAVPFALEEQLTEDVDQLSFALGRRRTGGRTQVAVVSRSALQGWLAQLSVAGLNAQAIYPDISLIPENPTQTVMWLEKGRLAVRRPGALPFAVELSPVREAMVVAGVIADSLDTSEAALLRSKESALLYITREEWALVQSEIEVLVDSFESLKVQLLADGPLPWLALSLERNDAVNLLQGEYAQAKDYGSEWRAWRTPALLAAGLLAVHVGAQAMQIRQVKQQSQKLDGEIAQVFTAAMPNETVHDPRRQMQSRLDRIRKSGGGPEYFLSALQTLSGALASTPKTDIQSLAYREDSMDLRINAPGLGELSQLSQQMGKQGLNAEIQSSTPVAGGVEAHLQVRSQRPGKHK